MVIKLVYTLPYWHLALATGFVNQYFLNNSYLLIKGAARRGQRSPKVCFQLKAYCNKRHPLCEETKNLVTKHTHITHNAYCHNNIWCLEPLYCSTSVLHPHRDHGGMVDGGS